MKNTKIVLVSLLFLLTGQYYASEKDTQVIDKNYVQSLCDQQFDDDMLDDLLLQLLRDDEQTNNNLFESNVSDQEQQDLNNFDEHGKIFKIVETQTNRKRKNESSQLLEQFDDGILDDFLLPDEQRNNNLLQSNFSDHHDVKKSKAQEQKKRSKAKKSKELNYLYADAINKVLKNNKNMSDEEFNKLFEDFDKLSEFRKITIILKLSDEDYKELSMQDQKAFDELQKMRAKELQRRKELQRAKEFPFKRISKK